MRPDRPRASRAVVRGRNGMAAAAQPLAAEAAVRVLRDGGTAADAAIACNAVLAVVEPVSCGLGGDLFVLAWDPRAGGLVGLDASGRSARAAKREAIEPGLDGTIPLDSPHSWTVPGVIDGWFKLHGKLGRLPMKRLLEDAERIAREGFPVSEVVSRAWARGAEVHRAKAGFADVFMPDGRAPREGELFRNEALAETFSLLRKEGCAAFTRGALGLELVRFARANGSLLAVEDLAETEASWVEPLSASYRGHELWELPPAGQGLAALEMLNVAEAAGVSELTREHADWWHVLVEAKKLAFADRARWLADPGFVPAATFLASKDHARRRAALLDRARAALEATAGDAPLDRAETTYLATGDSDGMLVSLIQSNYTGFGSGHALPALGFSLQNRGALFSLDPAHPNRLEPGKRPFHTIIPGFVTRAGRPWMAFGVMGGDMQPQGHVQVLLNLVDHGMDLQEAGDAARFHHAGSDEPTGTVMTDGGALHLEPEVPSAIARELERRGHRVGDLPFAYGGYQAVARDPDSGVLSGATERRKDGCALGW